MTMTGQGESQPVEGASALDDLAAALTPQSEQDNDEDRDADPNASDEGEEGEQDEAEEEEADGEDEAEPEKLKFTIKHDGKDVELDLTPEEHVELLQKSFDYTKKTTALAEERKALEPIKAHAEHLRQQHEAALGESSARLQAIVEFMTAELGEPPPVEWASQDAGYYIAQKEQYESRRGKLEKAQAALQQVQMETARSRQAATHQQIAETRRVLKDTLPDWNDAKEVELAQYVGAAGLTPDKADSAFWDAAFWQIAHKAKAYDAIQAKKAEMKPVKQLAKVNKPAASANTTGKQAERVKREANFNKNPSVDALAALLR